IQTLTQQDKWCNRQALSTLQSAIRDSLAALPLPVSRLETFDNCCDNYQHCLRWLEQGDEMRTAANQAWMDRTLAAEQPFFETVESSPLNMSQSKAVINGEEGVLVLAGAGSGKTSVLVARAAWLMH
ncbi:UvrD-helicase domain-containing protein, partial [Escherichia coli]